MITSSPGPSSDTERDVQRVHRAVREEDVVLSDVRQLVLRTELLGERRAELGDSVVRDVVGLAGLSRRGDRVEHMRRDREARIARLEPDDSRALRLGAEQHFADLHDLPERDVVESIAGEVFRDDGREC